MKQEPDKTPGAEEPPEGWLAPLPATLPEPTAWPVALAFGCALLSWGILTSWVISAVGLVVFLVSAGGWIGRMRDEQP